MLFPALKSNKEKTGSLSRFTSLVTKGIVPDGAFSQEKNLTCDLYPYLCTRRKRGVYASSAAPLYFSGEKITAIKAVFGGILICTETAIYLDGVRLSGSLSPDFPVRTIVPFGRNAFIVPDGVYVRCTDEGTQVSDCTLSASYSDCQVYFCMEDGTELFPNYLGDFPSSAAPGELAVVGDGADGMECWQYTGEIWKKRYSVYLKIFCRTGISGLGDGQSVFVTGGEGRFTDGWRTVISHTPSSVVLTGNLASDGTCSEISFSKYIPPMDFAVEHNNRVYGCRYGKGAEGGFVNEIYISKLGDPCEWYSYQGISTDSYTVSLGCSGEFTGAAVLGGEVLFFKEDRIIRILGSMPSEFTVYTLPLTGIERGQHRSLVSAGDALIYKSREGISLYDGSTVTCISPSLELSSLSQGVAGTDGEKYYVALSSADGERSLFVYDLKRGIWHREDEPYSVTASFTRDGNLFFLGADGVGNHTVFTPCYDAVRESNRALPLKGEAAFLVHPENEVEFYWETGRLFEDMTSFSKKIRCIRLAVSVPRDAYLKLFIRTDASAEPVPLFFIDRETDGIFSCTVPVPPCRFFYLSAEGRGEVIVGAIDCAVRLHSEVREID